MCSYVLQIIFFPLLSTDYCWIKYENMETIVISDLLKSIVLLYKQFLQFYFLVLLLRRWHINVEFLTELNLF